MKISPEITKYLNHIYEAYGRNEDGSYSIPEHELEYVSGLLALSTPRWAQPELSEIDLGCQGFDLVAGCCKNTDDTAHLQLANHLIQGMVTYYKTRIYKLMDEIHERSTFTTPLSTGT